MTDYTLPPTMLPQVQGLLDSSPGGSFGPLSFPFSSAPNRKFVLGVSAKDLVEVAERAQQEYQVSRYYLELLEGYEFVRAVLSERDNVVRPRLWTIISAPPFDSRYRRLLYEAQAAATRLGNRPVIDFRLLNTEELSGDLGSVLPANYQTLFSR